MTPIKVLRTERLLPHVRMDSHALHTKDVYETRSKHPRVSLNATMKGIPAFLRSLYHIIDDESSKLIHWSDDGSSFFIQEPDRFAKEVLGKWFKHANYSSFVRQLNNYGFHKILHLQQGALHSNGAHEYHHYMHSDFRRGRNDLLGQIQRKGQSVLDDPIKSSEVHNQTSVKKEDLTMAEVAPAEDSSRSRLLEAILLEVEGLKHREGEQDRESGILRDRIGVLETNVARHQDLMLRLLACLGLIPIAEHHWATRGHSQLMIQGAKENDGPGKAKTGEEAAGLDGNRAISSPISSHQPTVSRICDVGDYSDAGQGSSPTSMDGPPSPPPSSPSDSVVGSNQSAGHLGLIFGENTQALVDCGGPEISNQAPDFSGNLTDYPLSPLQSDRLYSDTFLYPLVNSKFIDFSGESLVNSDQNYGMDEISPSIFPDFPFSPTLGSSSGSATASNPILEPDATSSIQIATDIPTTSPAQGDSTLTTASGKGIKRKKDLMDESRTECASHASVSSLSLHDTQPPANFFHHTTSLPLKGRLVEETMRSTQPRVPSASNFTFDVSTTFTPSGDESENRSSKRARSTSASKRR